MNPDLNIVECIQGSKEWFDARIGVLSSSRVADAVTRRKRKPEEPLQAYLDLRLDLAIERVCNKPQEHFVSKWMELGKEREPLARAAYELRQDIETEQVGFVFHPEIRWAGASPDGFVGEDGLVEFKCPKSNTHGEYLLAEVVPAEYQPQILWQMAACPNVQWCDFVSYHPDFPAPLDLFICRLRRDNQQIAVMEAQAEVFLKEVEDLTLRLRHGLAGALEASLAANLTGRQI